ncbi:unnamed protein product [Diabrotica balteata]|uniref:AB hydrolase-1 domain-containing protein n=1 Tax=Diabrotica balteata TaxID=107213 RepID=A0A9N9X931_DIABA|nr:unnamed protein product [Diabrotica balteata]
MDTGRSEDKPVTEFNISVPWGHIRVKAWGSADNPHVLVFHGLADNAGSFDNLMPYLSNSFYYLCMELPGHGKSSHFPSNLPIHTTDYIIVYKLIAEHFKQKKYIIVSHSLGAQIAMMFARVYPDYVEKLIGLELIPPVLPDAKRSIKYVKSRLELFENIASRGPASYSYDEALESFSKNRYADEVLTKEAAEPILKRCLQQQDNGRYIFTTDERIKAYINPLHDMRYEIESFKSDPLKCPTLIILSKLNDRPRKKYRDLISKWQACNNITITYVDGHHDIHNNNPRRVAPYINKFLLAHQSKL